MTVTKCIIYYYMSNKWLVIPKINTKIDSSLFIAIISQDKYN